MESRRENDQGHYELAGQTCYDRKNCKENNASQESIKIVIKPPFGVNLVIIQ